MSGVKGIILPIAYFPPLSYFACLASGSDVLIETGETYPKQTLRNRCEIGSSGGKQRLVVPIHKPHGNPTRTHEVLLSGHGDWRNKHWKALETAYSSSPFFLFYADSLQQLLFAPFSSLEELNLAILRQLLETLDLHPRITVSHDYLKDAGDLADLRDAFKKARPWPEGFKPYPQVFSYKTGFLEDLSILDLLFNLGPEAVPYLRGANALIPPSFG